MVTIGLVKKDLKKFKNNKESFIGNFINLLKINKIDYCCLEEWGTPLFWDRIEDSKIFIARYKGNEEDIALMQAYLPEIERKGIKTLPNFNTAYHCGDKLKLAAFYRSNNIPTPVTFAAFSYKQVKRFVQELSLDFPLVIKLRKGTASKNVALVENEQQLFRVSRKLFKKGIIDSSLDIESKGKLNYLISSVFNRSKEDLVDQVKYYNKIAKRVVPLESTCLIIQEFLPNNEYDTRITTIGNRAFGFLRINRQSDFRASGSGNIEYGKNKIDLDLVEIALSLSKRYKFQTMAYDFVYDKQNKPSLLEMNYTYLDKAVQNCPGFWTEDGHYFQNHSRPPQYYQLSDLMGDKNLRWK